MKGTAFDKRISFSNDELIFFFFDVDEQLMIQLFVVWITNKDVAKGF